MEICLHTQPLAGENAAESLALRNPSLTTVLATAPPPWSAHAVDALAGRFTVTVVYSGLSGPDWLVA